MMKRILVTLLFVSLAAASLNAQNIFRKWEGAITIMGQQLGIVVEFKKSGTEITGNIDIPMQSAYGLKLSNIKSEEGKLDFEIAVAPGNVAQFFGNVSGDSIGGRFAQAGYDGTFSLIPKVEESKEPLPYDAREVTFKNGDIQLAGTLTLPKDAKKVPAVILLTGSGAQNRDEEIFGFKIFGLIADHLTRNGIAVLRYDDRGIGGSTGNMTNTTTKDFAGDALAAFSYLQGVKEIDAKKIGLLGHSEGGIAAGIAAAQNKAVSFVILMSAPAIPGKDIIISQVASIAKSSGKSDEEVKMAVELQTKIIQALGNNSDLEPLKEQVYKIRAKEMGLPDDDKPETEQVKNQLRQSIDMEFSSMQSPWYKYFLEYNPSDSYSLLKIPVLGLFGGLDMQVPLAMNHDPLDSALKKAGNKNYTIYSFPKANHLYQAAETGGPDEYSRLDKKFVDGFLKYLADWIKKTNKI